jgi:exosortase family protein XrtM
VTDQRQRGANLQVRRRVAFAIGLMLGYVILYAGYTLVPDALLRNQIYFYTLTAPAAQIIHWLAPVELVRAEQNLLTSARATLEIVRGCDGSGALFLLLAAIAIFPARLRAKLIGAAIGTLIIFTLNLQRIVGLYFIQAYYPQWFLPAHLYAAPTLLIIAVALWFLYWTASVAPAQR